MTLLAHGCPVQAIVAAFGVDERTVWRWAKEAGMQCRRVHEHVVEAGRIELSHVQADEIRVKGVDGVFWLANSIEVKSRLWLGGAISPCRDRELIRALLSRVRACGPVASVLLCTDGLASYAKQAKMIFRERSHDGRRGRPRLALPSGVMIAQAIKRYEGRRVAQVIRRVIVGAQAEVIERLIRTQRSLTAVINTAYVERLNATFRARLSPLARRTRCGVHKRLTLEWGMWLVGSSYNFCREHRSLRRRRCSGREGASTRRWVERTPAEAAGLTDHRWSMEELMSYVVPPAELPKRRGRPPRWLLEAA